MAYKQYNHETFSIVLNDADRTSVVLYCHAENTRYGFRHVCDFRRPGEYSYTRAKCCYYNRTWESFRYESVLHAAADKCPPKIAEAIREMCKNRADAGRRKAQEDIAAFEKAWNTAPAGAKDAVKGITIETEEDAAAVTGILQAAALLQTVSEK